MTTGGGAGENHAAGGPARHLPVLREAVIEALAVRQGGLYLDATFGAGGYTQAILDIPETHVLALDRDPTALVGGAALVTAAAGRLRLVQAQFSRMEAIAAAQALAGFDGIALDIGVSSMQIDEAERGFSFMRDGPLDMRMGMSGLSAADLVNSAEEGVLADIFFHLGEERAARRIARAIVMDRAQTPFTTTRQLAGMIARVVPGKPGDIHPATRSFQALRIAVNDELEELGQALAAAERLLKVGGRLAVVTFHSLEDRIVKRFFADRSGRGQAKSRRLPGEPEALAPTFDLPRGQPQVAADDEVRANPRARSAKLRFGIRTATPARADATASTGLFRIPRSLAEGR